MKKFFSLKNPPFLVIMVGVLIRVISVIFVPQNRRPTASMAWLMAIFASPIPGSILFAIFGTTKLPEQRRERQRDMSNRIARVAASYEATADSRQWPVWFSSLVGLNQTLGAMPIVLDNHATLLPDYEESIAAMTAEIREAMSFVCAEFYIFSLDDTTNDLFAALEEAQGRGVTVRVLYDHFATSHSPRYKQTKAWLTQRGIEFHEMLAFTPRRGKFIRPDLRNHRKLLIVDGVVAFMGSQNLVDASYNTKSNLRRGLRWKDLFLRLEGPVVTEVLAVFLTDWFSETDTVLDLPNPPDGAAPKNKHPQGVTLDCQVVPSGPGFEGENNLRLFNALVYAAERRLVITSPYFVPDDSMLYAITTAAQRGVNVELFACEVADQAMVYHAQRSYYEALLRSGVRIFLYRTPVVLHAKHFTVDDDTAVVGSSNMDMRSFSLNLESSLLIRSREFVTALRDVEDDYRANSTEVTLDEWLDRPLRSKVLDNLCRLTAAVE